MLNTIEYFTIIASSSYMSILQSAAENDAKSDHTLLMTLHTPVMNSLEKEKVVILCDNLMAEVIALLSNTLWKLVSGYLKINENIKVNLRQNITGGKRDS